MTTTPDATPTPRTDALGVHLQGTDIHYWWQSYERLARSLETELASQRGAQERIAELLVDLEIVNYSDEGSKRRFQPEYQRIRDFLISLAPDAVKEME